MNAKQYQIFLKGKISLCGSCWVLISKKKSQIALLLLEIANLCSKIKKKRVSIPTPKVF